MAQERLQPGTENWRIASSDHIMRYTYSASFADGKRILDAGCGFGYGAALLAAAGASSVVAIDIDKSTIASAQSMFKLPNLLFHVDDCQHLTVGGDQFDLICSFENIEHLNNPSAFLREAAARLHPDGLLLCSTPDRVATPSFVRGKPVNPYHTVEWYAEEFSELLRHHFEDVDLLAQVKRFSLVKRQDAATELQWLLTLIPERILRIAMAILAGRSSPASLLSLATPSPEDFPIVPRSVAHVHGVPFCHFAICRRPRG